MNKFEIRPKYFSILVFNIIINILLYNLFKILTIQMINRYIFKSNQQ